MTDKTVEQTQQVLDNPKLRNEMVDHNDALAKRYFSYTVLEHILRHYMIEHNWLAPEC